MARSATFVAIIMVASLVAGTARGGEALTPEDYQWLAANLTVTRASPTLEDLAEAEKEHLHGLINAKATIDKKRQEVTEFLTDVTGNSLEDSLSRSEQ